MSMTDLLLQSETKSQDDPPRSLTKETEASSVYSIIKQDEGRIPDANLVTPRSSSLKNKVSRLFRRVSISSPPPGAILLEPSIQPLTPIRDAEAPPPTRLRPPIVPRNSIEVTKARARRMFKSMSPRSSRSSINYASSDMTTVYTKPIRENDEDYEKTSVQFVEHKRRSHSAHDTQINSSKLSSLTTLPEDSPLSAKIKDLRKELMGSSDRKKQEQAIATIASLLFDVEAQMGKSTA